MNRTVSIATLGCKTNQYESAAMEERLRQAGYQVVPFEQGADLVIVNTCTVTAATDSQSRNLIRRARRLNDACRVVVTGCYAQVDPEALRAIDGVSVVLGNSEKKDFLEHLDGSAEGQVEVSDIRMAEEAVPLTLTGFTERSRAFVQIQNGCDAFCSYCIIPYARGRSRSVQPDEVLVQIANLVKNGFPEVVLTGIHIGGYGADLQPAFDLLGLVRRIEEKTEIRRLRLGSIEPTEISDALIETVAESAIVCPHFHIPLQSGSDEVLKAMNRHYTTAYFCDLAGRIRSRLPEAAIGLDVIVGFPGESDELFEQTYRFIEDLPATHLHVFPFSRRPGTPAAAMPDQVPGNVAKERAERLRALGKTKEDEFARQFVGRTVDVVVEGGRVGPLRKGLTRNYLNVFFAAEESRVGHLDLVRVESIKDGKLIGRLV